MIVALNGFTTHVWALILRIHLEASGTVMSAQQREGARANRSGCEEQGLFSFECSSTESFGESLGSPPRGIAGCKQVWEVMREWINHGIFSVES